ncbi:MAG TPA: UDP-N-acetylglucosamine--N-acetylmuramyl-(pentapeptide) pyrophosphoryl-undecaprenol N-acetylglucosamine transferase [Phycisphaerae bacterium]|nr:UDP-N-acetylglucosamine--N-acetylmuramyl-(pentapeptide) pyrophosphoryl-undecaprenol N-acetylglucosamine transferase [Phycisphaerae bacterium]HPU25662.1 UDP-N-acetylglucosamine--N-acetylmuramyl-(pentapeptide) pyrophosphoryl-undecaprenol N-acetylglucosamine transferase [Phycisphaerae bacterium]
MSNRPWYVFAGGGTGGHLFPGLSVVDSLRRMNEADVSFFCTDRPIDRDILGAAGVEAVVQTVLPFPAKPWRWPKFLLRWGQSVRSCLRAFSARRPAFVVGAGGYASGPPVYAAAKLAIPTFLLNPDAVPGRANRHMVVRANVRCVFAQWEVTRQHFPAGVPIEVSGCPVRPAFRRAAGLAPEAIRESFGLDPHRPMLLVTGASQGARTINEAMLTLAGAVAAADWQVLHLSGATDAERVEQAYRQSNTGLRYRVLAFTDRMPEAMAAADLIISRAGASTLSEIQAMGKPSVLFPYPYHRDQHQRHNAAVLAEAGAAVLLDDAKDATANAAQLGPVLARLMGDAAERERMARAASSLDVPDSADRIAARLLEVSQQGEKLQR